MSNFFKNILDTIGGGDIKISVVVVWGKNVSHLRKVRSHLRSVRSQTSFSVNANPLQGLLASGLAVDKLGKFRQLLKNALQVI